MFMELIVAFISVFQCPLNAPNTNIPFSLMNPRPSGLHHCQQNVGTLGDPS
jgi:hypothetical protein